MPKASPWWQYCIAGPKTLWTFFGLPRALRNDMPKADVVFSPTHYVPRFISMPRVMSIMDLSYLQYPELFQRKDLHKLVHWTRYSVSHVAAVLTISEFSKNDIIDTYHTPEANVSVTYPGLSQKLQFESQHMEKKYAIAKHYILSVGTIQPRKNYARLIEAFSEFLKLNKQKFGLIDLVIVGKKGWLYEEILEAPKKYGVEDRVKFLDFVPDNDLPSLYKHALCFALPSLYEGFGLPVLEAMAQGCPVVVSSVSSLPEIAGKAGIYVTPEDTKSITQGLLTAVRQRNLIQGRSRIKKGLEQVKKFTWEEAAKQTIAVLERVARKGARV
jgi:glycosyltransferase involved in cell wall biosynthesis